MNDKFREELDHQLSDISWNLQNTKEVMKQVKMKKRHPVRMTMVLAAAIAALLALSCVGFAAELFDELIDQIFRGRAVRQETVDLLQTEQHSMTKDGITVTVLEYVFEGETMFIRAEMRNDTEDALLGTIAAPEINGIYGDVSGEAGILNRGDRLVMIQPGESAVGTAEVDFGRKIADLSEGYEVSLGAMALRPLGEVQPDVNDLPMYSVSRYYDTGLTEQVFLETLTFTVPPVQGKKVTQTRPGITHIRLQEYGYTLSIKEAKFTAAASRVLFELIPDDVADIQAYGDEGTDGHARLYRKYEILDENGDRLFKGLTGAGGHGWSDESHTAMGYSFNFKPLSEVPKNIVLVPLNDAGEYLMDEAVTIPIIID